MSSLSENNKRIAKNTLVLYARMLLTVGISFYSTRLILANLGVSDYGLYNVVGGLVSMLYIVTTTLTESIGRFLTYGLGKNNVDDLKKTFSTSLSILLVFSSVVVFLGETMGVWFLNYHLNIAEDRYVAANWIFQFSLLSFVLEMCIIPFNALIIAHERMKAFASVTIIDVLLKLCVAFLLAVSPIDRLIFYGVLMLGVSIVRQGIYICYSVMRFGECRFHFVFEKDLYRPILNFAGLKLLSVTGTMIATTGVSILLNMFYGTVVNAAKGIANQIQNYAGSFTKNFMTALNPQIIKSYAGNQVEYLVSLVYRGSVFSYLLFFIVAFPILCELDFILSIWLEEVPTYTATFIQYTLIGQLLLVTTDNVLTLNNAIGRIKEYEMVSFCCYMLVLPISWVFFKFDYAPTITVVIYYSIMAIARTSAIAINRKYVPVTFVGFYKHVCVKLFRVSIIAVLLTMPFRLSLEAGWIRFLMVGLVSTSSILLSSYLIALDKNEQYAVMRKINQGLHRRGP